MDSPAALPENLPVHAIDGGALEARTEHRGHLVVIRTRKSPAGEDWRGSVTILPPIESGGRSHVCALPTMQHPSMAESIADGLTRARIWVDNRLDYTESAGSPEKTD